MQLIPLLEYFRHLAFFAGSHGQYFVTGRITDFTKRLHALESGISHLAHEILLDRRHSFHPFMHGQFRRHMLEGPLKVIERRQNAQHQLFAGKAANVSTFALNAAFSILQIGLCASGKIFEFLQILDLLLQFRNTRTQILGVILRRSASIARHIVIVLHEDMIHNPHPDAIIRYKVLQGRRYSFQPAASPSIGRSANKDKHHHSAPPVRAE